MNKNMEISPIGDSWKAYRRTHYSPEEIAENDLTAELIGEIAKARREHSISQRELEAVSGIRQSVIAGVESGETDPQLSTLLKLLIPMGKTLAVVPLEPSGKS